MYEIIRLNSAESLSVSFPTLDERKIRTTVSPNCCNWRQIMNRVVMGCVGLLALAGGAAAAADLPQYYQPGPAYNPIYTWTGFSFGLNGGGGRGRFPGGRRLTFPPWRWRIVGG